MSHPGPANVKRSLSEQDQDPKYVHGAFSAIAPRYALTNHVLSLGVDILWRKKVARLVAERTPSLVLDVATGSGDLAAAVSRACPAARVIGCDFCLPMLEQARHRGLENLLVADGMRLPFADGAADALTIGYGLRNMENWAGALAEFARVLRPGGLLAVLDFSLPRAAALRGPYRFYLHRVLPRIAGWISGEKGAYVYLGESIERFPRGGEMRALLERSGFGEVRCRPLLGGISSVYTAMRKT